MQVTIYSETDELIHVEATITPGSAGISGLYGQRETPDDEDDIEITHAYNDSYEDVVLTAEEFELAMDALEGELAR